MAITRIAEVATTGTASGTTFDIDISGLTLAQNDLLLIFCAIGDSTSNLDMSASGNNSGAFVEVADLYGNDTNDTNFYAGRLFVGATPDTTVTISGVQNGNDPAVIVVQYRGVDTSTPMDVAATTATGTNSDLADPAAITPTTSGAKVVAGFGGSQQSAAAWTAPANMSNFVQQAAAQKGLVAVADANWSSGSFNPDAVTGGNSDVRNSWAAVTMALRPSAAPIELVPASGSSATTAANVTLVYPGAVSLAPISASSATTAGLAANGNYGPNVLPNGDFSDGSTDWTIGSADWTISGGAAHAVNAASNDSLTSSYTTGNSRIRISFDVTAYTSGGVSRRVGASAANYNAIGSYSSDLVIALGSDVRFTGQTGNNFTGTIDNVSVQEDNAILLVFKIVLAPASASSATTADSPTLQPKTTLAPSGSNSVTSADNVTLGMGTLLAPASANSATTAGSPTLAPKTTLTVNSASSITTAGSPTLAPKTVLAPASANSVTTADNVQLTMGALIVQPAISNTTAASPTLSVKYALVPASATSLTTANSPTLLPKTAIAPSAATSATTAGSPTLAALWLLVPSPASSDTTAESPVLVYTFSLEVDETNELPVFYTSLVEHERLVWPSSYIVL